MLHKPSHVRAHTAQETFPADLHELLKQFGQYQGTRRPGPLLVDRAQSLGSRPAVGEIAQVFARGVTALAVTAALFAGGIAVIA